MKKLHREPVVENKYHLNTKKVKNLKILNREKLKDFGFWYNSVVCGWCYSFEIGDETSCADNSFWLCVYDDRIINVYGSKREINKQLGKEGTVDFHFCVYGSSVCWDIQKFYNPRDIENENDLKIQEIFIKKINELIDENILKIS